MERLKERLNSGEQALATFREALTIAKPSKLERDGTVQRFEYTFESCWKSCQRYLEVREGIVCASPKACFRAIGDVGIMSEAQTELALKMTDDRNDTVHLYREPVAVRIYGRLKSYASLMEGMIAAMKQRSGISGGSPMV